MPVTLDNKISTSATGECESRALLVYEIVRVVIKKACPAWSALPSVLQVTVSMRSSASTLFHPSFLFHHIDKWPLKIPSPPRRPTGSCLQEAYTRNVRIAVRSSSRTQNGPTETPLQAFTNALLLDKRFLNRVRGIIGATLATPTRARLSINKMRKSRKMGE